MKQTTHTALAVLFSIALSTAAAQADEHKSYGKRFGHKIVNGFSNMALSVLEIPKNIINTTNQSNIFYGLTGGLAKGIINTVGRTAAGATDFITSPLPTKQFVEPAYPWQEYFEKDTTYGQVFNIDAKDN